METRICNTCSVENQLSEQFYRKSIFLRKDGTEGISFMRKCLVCHNKWQMERYLYNQLPKEKISNTCKYCGQKSINIEFETAFMCLICFKNKKSEQDREYRIEHKLEKAATDKEYQIKNKKIIAEKKKDYYLANKTQFIARGVRNEKKRRLIDPAFRLRKCVSSSIKKCINKKKFSFTKFVPYTIQELKEHLEKQFEPWMNWDNQGVYKLNEWDDNDPLTWKWNIDHIKPQSSFKYTTMYDLEFRKCWALNNLRPYSAKQNIIDNDRNW